LERLRQIADALDCGEHGEAATYIVGANGIVGSAIVKHERDDEEAIYPRVSDFLADSHGLRAMSRAHREIMHQARLLARLAEGLRPQDIEPYLMWDAQRIVESIVSLVHIHNAQEEDIYEHAAAQLGNAPGLVRSGAPKPVGEHRPTAFGRALGAPPNGGRRWAVMASALIALAIAGSGALWGGWHYWRIHRPPQPQHETPVEVAATISAFEAISIKADISGVIDAVYCDLGAMVQAGQVCATIEARALYEDLVRKEASLRRATAEAERARGDAEQSKAAVERMEADGARSRKLLSAARKAHDRAQDRVGREEGRVATAETAVKATRRAFERMKLVSPIAGTIITRAAEVGREVGVGGEPLLLVAGDLSVVKVEARVDAATARDRKLGDNVSSSVDEVAGRLFQGEVTQMSQAAKVGSADEINLVLTTNNSGNLLRPGTSVKIHLGQSMTGP
jgi:multidrug efflux pump subunit AcrA (membrane-fusion protein)